MGIFNKKRTIIFQDLFRNWVMSSLSENIPQSTKALNFNLFQYGNHQYGVELIGASRFDINDNDWPCDECWEPSVRSISIPESECLGNWEVCLSNISSLVKKFIMEDFSKMKINNQIIGIGIGFVDGDLHILYPVSS